MSLSASWKTAGVMVGLAVAAAACQAQQQTCPMTDENGKTVTLPSCSAPSTPGQTAPATPAPGTTPSAAKRFPFPGEPAEDKSTAPAGQTPSQPNAPGTTPPAAGSSGDSNQPLTKKFPFPGESGNGGTKPAPPAGGGLQDAGSSGDSSDAGSSSSSSSSSSFAHDNTQAGPLGEEDNDPAAKAAAARKNRKKLPPVARQTPTEQEQEDLTVAQFYQDKGSYKGAYLRATDAVLLAVDDPDAHFALAEAARKLGKLDEAETHYKKCLALDPVPKIKRAAEAALKQMAGG